MHESQLDSADSEVRKHSALWLLLATAAVALSGFFAILIALARVPALGQLFPGPEFYRIALTLHVSLSQGVWFMAFAGALWSLAASRQPSLIDKILWVAAALGTAGIALSVGAGEIRPIMSNYIPVLDSVWFIGALLIFGLAILLKAFISTLDNLKLGALHSYNPINILLMTAAATVVIAAIVLILAHQAIADQLSGYAYFELLFWGPGHIWQFALAGLMAVCWLDLAAQGGSTNRIPRLPLVLTVTAPVILALVLAIALKPTDSGYLDGYTALMRWTSWLMPALVAWAILPSLGNSEAAPGLRLSMVLFVVGLLIGATIRTETTLITAHYHGTIGAVTLAFMAFTLANLPRFGADPIPRRKSQIQIGLYGYGILLMIAGLAGAGLMGAPRKTPGALDALWNVETVSRIFLGVGGVLATAGIIYFATLIIPRLIPSTKIAVLSR